MKKSVISLMLTLSLLLGTVLGCFSLPVAAAESAASAASITDVKSAVVGPELQVIVNATGAKSYKLYENGTCVAESEYPIIVYAGYDATKTYGVSAVDENGNETAVTNIENNGIVKPEVEEYHASNILAGKPFQMADYAQKWAYGNATYGDWNTMTDGDFNTRYSVNAKVESIIDGVVSLGGTYTLGELRLYDYDGSGGCRTCGNNLVVEIYTDGKWVEVVNYNLAQMQANHSKLGMRNGYISVDLFGYNGEAIRIYNDGMTVANDCLGYWEITLSGVLLSSYSDYIYKQHVESAYTESSNLFAGLSFIHSPDSTITWISGTKNPATMTDGNYSSSTYYKVDGSRIEFEITFDSDYAIVDEITVTYLKNTGESPGKIGNNSHYVNGQDVVIYAYFAGVWREVYAETFTENTATKTFNLGGILAEKIRYYVPTAKTYYYYDQAELYTDEEGKKHAVLDDNGNPVVKEYNVKGTETGIGIVEMTASGRKVNYQSGLVEKDNLLLGETFVPSTNMSALYVGTFDDLTDGDATDRMVTSGKTLVDITLAFGGVAVLNDLHIVYESAARSGVDILIEVIYNGETYAIVDEDYAEGYSTRTFDMGGILAEKLRIYISAGRSEGNCTGIREISCTGSVSSVRHQSESHENILLDKTITAGPAHTAIHANNIAGFGYGELNDTIKSYVQNNGRFSTAASGGSNSPAVMDAVIELIDEYLDLGELRLYDFNTNEKLYAGTSLQIMALVRGSWVTLYDLSGVESIYDAHRVGSYLSFDLGGVNATALRIIAKQENSGTTVSLYEIELSASWIGYADEKVEMDEKQDEVAEKVNEGNNVLLGLTEANAKIIANGTTVAMNANHPLRYAFDGIIEPDIVNGKGTMNRYATQGNMTPIKDASGNQIGAYYYLEIDLENATRLYTLSIYEWRSNSGTTRSNKTSIEVKINGNWVKVVSEVSLSTDAKVDRTDFDLGGVAASGIRITFLNDYYEGHATQTGLWPTPTIKEITCTGEVSYGDILDAFESIKNTDTSVQFGLDEVKNQKLEALKSELLMAGATSAEMLAKINEFNSIADEFAKGTTPVTDAYGDFKQANISLAGNVGFNFYGALDENVEAQFPNASVVVRYNTVLEGVVTTNTEVIKLGELAKDKNGRYIVDFDMAAAQMTDDVEIRLVLDGDNCGEHITWSVKDYCDVILAGDYDQKLKDVVTAMLNYGAYAQSYFGYKTDDLAADLSDLGSITETAKPVVAGSVSGVNLNRWTLTLDSNVTMKLYFTLDGVNPEDLTVTVTGPDGSVTTVDALELVGARYRVTINDITSGYLNDNYVVTVTAGEETLTVTSSAMCYVSGVLAMENPDPALVNLVTALKLYSVAADAYFGK